MDCVEEIAALKRELGPLVGGAEFLSFDLPNSRLTILRETSKENRNAIIRAVSKFGMAAIPWEEVEKLSQPVFFKRHLRLIFTTFSVALMGLALLFSVKKGVAA